MKVLGCHGVFAISIRLARCDCFVHGERSLKRAVIQKCFIIFPNYDVVQRVRFNPSVSAVKERKRDIMLARR